MEFEKQYVKRNISGYVSPYHDPFSYRSLSEVGEHKFSNIFKEVMGDSLSRDDSYITDAKKELNTLIELAGMAFDPHTWFLVEMNNEPIGLVLPQKFPHKPKSGTIFYIGILSKYRGRKFAKLIQAKAFEVLSSKDVEEYIGSADVQNLPMLKVFEANKCCKTEIRKHHVNLRN
jgi:hypothetical protein